MARLFTKTDLERAARLAAQRMYDQPLGPPFTVEDVADWAANEVAHDPLALEQLLLRAYRRGEDDALAQVKRTPEEAVRDLLP